ncbi:MAG TPA: L-threonylcarbamoyladenylate synthase [Candidatus Saccharimonadales bacterium]|nr:L-threonylcarbamoyladenylate synthase [Candidatus Saccharimonadales bacterium]
MSLFADAHKALVKPGTVGVIPTDTVYGVIARAEDHEAVARLYQLKSRENKPGTIIAANLEQLEKLGLKHRYLKAVEQFWPGAVSVVIPSGPELDYLHLGQGSLAVRIPDFPELQKLLGQTGPLLTSSANHPGEPLATNIGMAKKYFGDQVDFYSEGGDLSDHQPSTIIRVVDDAIEVLRQGSVKV